jgi:anaerobic magnesium-protoporphyrin IX monomethyl ester cyclase
MKIILINPPALKVESCSLLGITVPPLGLAYLAAVLEKEGHLVKIIDAPVLKASLHQVERELECNQPGMIGVTSTTPTIYEALSVIKVAKKVCPNAVTVLGGPHASFLASETLKGCRELDVTCRGEGEKTILELVRAVEQKESLSNVKGIVFRSGENIIETMPQPWIKDLDSLPFPARHLLPMDKYTILGKKSTIGNIISSRGCPFYCTFCESSLLFGRMFRARSPKNVVDEMKQLINEYHPKTIEFSDDLFTLNMKRTETICDEIRRRGLDIPWACSSRVDTVSRSLLRKMKKAGCILIYYGVESGSQRVLNLMRKHIKIEQIIKAIKWTKEVGIEILASFIIGFPGETREDMQKTIAFAKRLDVDYAQFSFATPYPGTELYQMAKEKGLLLTEDWSQYTAGKPVIAVDNSTKDDLTKLLKKAYQKFYLSPKLLLRHLSKRRFSLFFKVIQWSFQNLLK